MSSPWRIVEQAGSHRCRLIHRDAAARGLGPHRDGTVAIAARDTLEHMVRSGTADIRLRAIHGNQNISTRRGATIEVVGGHSRTVHRQETGHGARR